MSINLPPCRTCKQKRSGLPWDNYEWILTCIGFTIIWCHESMPQLVFKAKDVFCTSNIKFKDVNPSIKSTRQMKAWIDTTQRKETKANNQWKIRKRRPYANRTQGHKMMINDNKEDLRRKNSRLPQISKWQSCNNYDVWKRWRTLTKCSNPLKNCYGLRTLQGYGQTLSIVGNEHWKD